MQLTYSLECFWRDQKTADYPVDDPAVAFEDVKRAHARGDVDECLFRCNEINQESGLVLTVWEMKFF